jgi:hypothetical protein
MRAAQKRRHYLAIPRMAMKRQFADDIVAAIRGSKGLRIRAGTGQHRFIGIWVVVVRGRVFVRSWSVKPNGRYRTLLKEPRGTIQLKDQEIAVRALLWSAKTSCSRRNAQGSVQMARIFLKLCSAAEGGCAKLNGHVLVPSDSLP